MKREHGHDPERCPECNRIRGCAGCGQSWPDGRPGYWDETAGGWVTGSRPIPVRPTAAVVSASKALDRAQTAYDDARRVWEQAARARMAHESWLAANSRDV